MMTSCTAGGWRETLLHMYPLQHQTLHVSAVRLPTVLVPFWLQYFFSFSQMLSFAHRFAIIFLPSCSKVIVKHQLQPRAHFTVNLSMSACMVARLHSSLFPSHWQQFPSPYFADNQGKQKQSKKDTFYKSFKTLHRNLEAVNTKLGKNGHYHSKRRQFKIHEHIVYIGVGLVIIV